jgi:hypothetical protein
MDVVSDLWGDAFGKAVVEKALLNVLMSDKEISKLMEDLQIYHKGWSRFTIRRALGEKRKVKDVIPWLRDLTKEKSPLRLDLRGVALYFGCDISQENIDVVEYMEQSLIVEILFACLFLGHGEAEVYQRVTGFSPLLLGNLENDELLHFCRRYLRGDVGNVLSLLEERIREHETSVGTQ